MGNNCLECKQPTVQFEHQTSPYFQKILTSRKVENQFPESSIPQTVKQKIKLLGINLDIQNSQVWKTQIPKKNAQESDLIIFTIVNKQNLKKQDQNKSEQVVVAKIQGAQKQQSQIKSLRLDPHKFEKAFVFIFKSESNNASNAVSSQNSLNLNLVLQQVYYGSISQTMHAQDATLIKQNGEYYKGNIIDNQLKGKGCMINSIGNHKYDGEWENNKPQGKGIQQLKGKFQYDGSFKNGKWNGFGKLTILSDSNNYHLQGNFVDGMLEGLGKILNKKDQLVFQGQFKNGKQHGKGKWLGTNGDSYIGEFIQGVKSGVGKFIFASGDVYEGNFKNGVPEGDGIIIKSGKRTRGYWYQGNNVLAYQNQNSDRV